jgi:hypothetical protein
MNGDRLTQIGESVERGELRLPRIAGDDAGLVRCHGIISAAAQVEAYGAVAADEIVTRIAAPVIAIQTMRLLWPEREHRGLHLASRAGRGLGGRGDDPRLAQAQISRR